MSIKHILPLSFYTHLKEVEVSISFIRQAKSLLNTSPGWNVELIFYWTGNVYYDDPGNDKQKWRVHKDGFMILFESVKWPGFYLDFGDQIRCPTCSLEPDGTCKWEVYLSNGLLCTNCSDWVKKVWWRTSIFDENAVIDSSDDCWDW